MERFRLGIESRPETSGQHSRGGPRPSMRAPRSRCEEIGKRSVGQRPALPIPCVVVKGGSGSTHRDPITLQSIPSPCPRLARRARASREIRRRRAPLGLLGRRVDLVRRPRAARRPRGGRVPDPAPHPRRPSRDRRHDFRSRRSGRGELELHGRDAGRRSAKDDGRAGSRRGGPEPLRGHPGPGLVRPARIGGRIGGSIGEGSSHRRGTLPVDAGRWGPAGPARDRPQWRVARAASPMREERPGRGLSTCPIETGS